MVLRCIASSASASATTTCHHHGNYSKRSTTLQLFSMKRKMTTATITTHYPSISCCVPLLIHSNGNNMITTQYKIFTNGTNQGSHRHYHTNNYYGYNTRQENRVITSYPFATHDNNNKRSFASFLFGRSSSKSNKQKQRPWHDPTFMQDSSPSELETWLLSLLQSTRNHAEEKKINYNNNNSDYSSSSSSATSSSSTSTNDPIVYFDRDFAVDSIAYLRVLEAYARSRSADSPQKAEYWIGVLERHYGAACDLYGERYGVDDYGGGSSDHYATADDSADADADDRTQQSQSGFALFKARSQNKSLSRDTTTTTPPKSTTSNRHRQQLLRQSSEKQTHTTTDIQREHAASIVRNLHPTVECYNAIIESWGHDNSPISVVRSRRWLSKLEDEAKKEKDITHRQYSLSPKLAPNAKSYDLYLHSCSRGLGKQPRLHAERAEEAHRILERRLGPDARSNDIRPTTESFNYVLRAYTRCRKDGTVARRVMELVLRMERIQKEYLLASSSSSSSEDSSWKSKAAPDTKTYSMAMDGWIIKAGVEADAWRSKKLRAMNRDRQLRAGNGRRRGRGNYDDDDDDTTNGEELPGPRRTIDDVGKDDGTKEMEKAETILKYIRDLDCIGHADVHATVIAHNILLSGWARLANELRPDVPLKSEQLLHNMIALAEDGNANAAPDVTSFNAVIKAWGRTKRPNSADRCEYWLRKMIRENNAHATNEHHRRQPRQSPNFVPKPNVQTYNLVMDAHFQLSDAARVQDMIVEMDGTNGLVVPNNESFSKVIRAWLNDELNEERGRAQYGLPGLSVENAWRWLDELLQREKKQGDCNGNGTNGELSGLLGPAPDLFSSILKTAARTSARGENMLMVGSQTFWAMKASRFPPDSSLAYTWLLEIALKVLSSPENDKRRREFVTSLFEQCCKDGFLSSKFVRKLSPFYGGPFCKEEGWTFEESKRVCEELFGDPPCFASAWSRNLKRGQEHPPQPTDLVQKTKS